ncbi:MAG: hypothetical protein JWL76_5 [Thermoleophilia bacterium]|nr:hypothetical protein [Thermoleophilia bacterium]
MMRALRHPPRSIACLVLLCAAIIGATMPGNAATSGSVVGVNVLGATTLDATLCASGDPTRTTLTGLVSGVSMVTSADCDVAFGSSNTTATLRTYMPSPRASALASATTNVTEVANGNRVLDMEMVDASTGWSVGDGTVNNRIRMTSDGGATWNPVANTLGGGGRSVSAPTGSIVWATRYANSNVIRTSNAGGLWTSRPLPGANARASNIYAADATTAWVVGSVDAGPRIWYTTDGGSNWNVVCDEITCSTSQWSDIDFAPGTTIGWAVNQTGDIWGTTDGSSWSLQTTTGNNLNAIDAMDPNRVIAVGSYGQVMTTTTGGATWNDRTPTDSHFTLRDISYRANGVVWIAGEYGYLAKSINHGLTFSMKKSRVESTAFAHIAATADDTVIAANFGELFIRTADAGSTWNVATVPTPSVNWADNDAADGARMWRVGSNGRIDRTIDGVTWIQQTSGTTEALHAVAVLDRSRVVVAGASGTILRTVDAGATWAPIASGTAETLRSVAVSKGEHVWIVGDNGMILRSTDAGATFAPVPSGMTVPLTAVGTWDGTTVLVGTANGNLRRSVDAGASWTSVAGDPTGENHVTAIRPVPETATVWAAWGANAARSTDNGATWAVTSQGSGTFVYDLDPVDSQTAWSGGRFGQLRRTTNGGATWSSAFTGSAGIRSFNSVVALGPDDASVVADADTTSTTAPGPGTPDYGDPGATWAGANGHFGICLRQAPGTGSTWPTTGSCPTSDGTNWRALPDHGGLAAASVATTLVPGTVTASFRFGVKVAATLPAGTYRAPIAFEVTAPGG